MTSLNIQTSGPLSGIAQIGAARHTTIDALQLRISDEIDDVHNEYVRQIQEAIFAAIRFCEREPFYFNQTRDVAFSTLDGQEFYTSAAVDAIGELGGLHAVYLEDGQGRRRQLRPISNEEMEVLNENLAPWGEPCAYVYFAQKLRLYPVPDKSYVIRLQISPMRLETIEDLTQVSAWFVEAADMVRARAKYELYKDILKDGVQAQAALNDFHEQREALRAETSRRNGTGRILATCF